ncbi:hypothetical protein H0I39_12235 [Ottowia beijingensis]|uniref:Uncharacterized protein n=1 Tax=Ottowia beijingensis TaxID=1207057 RepID=A0A853IVZ9_9BURK|nr:hypothetical protein [Ottowia beijingensis]NZA02331.1 hypothetical protein [Ottowia beijingensis]
MAKAMAKSSIAVTAPPCSTPVPWMNSGSGAKASSTVPAGRSAARSSAPKARAIGLASNGMGFDPPSMKR